MRRGNAFTCPRIDKASVKQSNFTEKNAVDPIFTQSLMEFHQEWPPMGRVTPACYLDLPGQLLALYAKPVGKCGLKVPFCPIHLKCSAAISCPIRPIRRPWQEMHVVNRPAIQRRQTGSVPEMPGIRNRPSHDKSWNIRGKHQPTHSDSIYPYYPYYPSYIVH